MLYRFDMVGKQDQDASAKTQFHVPQCFTGLCTDSNSILGFRNTPIVVSFVRDWWQMLDKYRRDEYWADPRSSLREMMWQYALYNERFRYYAIPYLCMSDTL
jgi:hypothetical protein